MSRFMYMYFSEIPLDNDVCLKMKYRQHCIENRQGLPSERLQVKNVDFDIPVCCHENAKST